jgi:flavin-dependent dehydrogenase
VSPQPSDEPKERVIDATGTARAYIGRYDFDILYPCIQKKVRFPRPPELRESVHRVGYSWIIPLEENTAHVGMGSITRDATDMAKVVEELARDTKTICGCQGLLRGTGPIFPLVRRNVWAVGEAGGLVDPISGAGIIPAMVSAKLLVEHWNDIEGYEAAIVSKYGWLRKSAELVQEWHGTGVLNIDKVLSLWKNYAEFIGLDIGTSGTAKAILIRNALRIALHVPSVRRRLRTGQLR